MRSGRDMARAYTDECMNTRPDPLGLWVSAITSQIGMRQHFGEVLVRDWQGAGLIAPGLVKPILFTAEATLIRKHIGQMAAADQAQVRAALAKLVG